MWCFFYYVLFSELIIILKITLGLFPRKHNTYFKIQLISRKIFKKKLQNTTKNSMHNQKTNSNQLSSDAYSPMQNSDNKRENPHHIRVGKKSRKTASKTNALYIFSVAILPERIVLSQTPETSVGNRRSETVNSPQIPVSVCVEFWKSRDTTRETRNRNPRHQTVSEDILPHGGTG